jgi:hypothetical protein
MSYSADEAAEWRGLIERLHEGKEPELPLDGSAPGFEDATARNRVGTLITRAVLGDSLYQFYETYCGRPRLPR